MVSSARNWDKIDFTSPCVLQCPQASYYTADEAPPTAGAGGIDEQLSKGVLRDVGCAGGQGGGESEGGREGGRERDELAQYFF